ncbi:hypothetical protein N7U66_11620 [Lacinutrix neustonica]|uniref:Uncharacterized protein n=1 Tax=Lacinutrix neustonica TaxID=2980107 RepID=A0A9E8MTM7_9FLAO|nr:hypothetical protein [Lacinutrix neustonica]WAC00886.1 hypothetical protein N7U66_11620 [Lacinutrix neustonica]
MIAAEEHALQPDTDGIFGVLNTTGNTSRTDFFDSLVKKTKHPLKSFKINKGVSSLPKTEDTLDSRTVEYVFEAGVSALDNISKYASKSRINLMCFNDKGHDKTNKNIKNVINKLNVSLLLRGIHKNDATEVAFK